MSAKQSSQKQVDDIVNVELFLNTYDYVINLQLQAHAWAYTRSAKAKATLITNLG